MKSMGSGWENLKIQLALKVLKGRNCCPWLLIPTNVIRWNFQLFLIGQGQPRDLQITAYKYNTVHANYLLADCSFKCDTAHAYLRPSLLKMDRFSQFTQTDLNSFLMTKTVVVSGRASDQCAESHGFDFHLKLRILVSACIYIYYLLLVPAAKRGTSLGLPRVFFFYLCRILQPLDVILDILD